MEKKIVFLYQSMQMQREMEPNGKMPVDGVFGQQKEIPNQTLLQQYFLKKQKKSFHNVV